MVPNPDEDVKVDQEPEPINYDKVRAAIKYPPIARDAGIDGTVVMRVLVDKDGTYQRHLLVSSPHPVLTRAVEQHLSELTFTIPTQDGTPILYWVNVAFKFVNQ